jgi:hypothetical protein
MMMRILRTIIVAALGVVVASLAGPVLRVQGATFTLNSTCDPAKTQILIGGQQVCLSRVDNDQDSIPDQLEDILLARYRPYYRFSQDGGQESFLPAGAIWYIQHSDLIVDGEEDSDVAMPRTMLAAHPELLLSGFSLHKANFLRPALKHSDLIRNPRRTDWHINIYNDFRHGEPLFDVLFRKNVGLYGHVTRLGGDYLVEYWQFFAFNTPDKVGDFGDHEGDWCTVQLQVNPSDTGHEIRTVTHFMHGLHQSFHLTLPHRTFAARPLAPDLQVEELQGQNFFRDFEAFAVGASASAHMNDNILRLVKSSDPGDDFLHPAVYIENGTHEFWPSEYGSFEAMPKHGGDGYRFLTAPPPNLGEVEHPRTPLSGVIMQYNGRWGAFSRSLGSFDTSPPPGPALHLEWHWPTGSALRAFIPTSDFEH